MGDSTELQILPTGTENDQDGIQQLEPEPESTPSSPLKIPELGVTDPAPTRVHVKRPFPGRGYFDVRDASKVELVMAALDLPMLIADVGFFVYSFVGTESQYLMAYSSLLTASIILSLFYKWYRVQGGFDTFTSLVGDFQPGTIGLIIALWVNVFSIVFGFANIAIQCFQSYIKIPIKGNVKKYLRAKQLRDRYEEIGLSGLLPCNEATNEILISDIDDGKYYTLRKVGHETPDKDVETPVCDVETPPLSAENLSSLGAQKSIRWLIGTMMVSYSDDEDWVTIKQKAEERAVKIFMEPFTPQQKCNFIEMMEAWKKRPSQGILKKIGRKRSHCFTLARLIDLTKHDFSVHLENTELRRIKVGAEVDTGVEDFIDSIWEVLEMVYTRAVQ